MTETRRALTALAMTTALLLAAACGDDDEVIEANVSREEAPAETTEVDDPDPEEPEEGDDGDEEAPTPDEAVEVVVDWVDALVRVDDDAALAISTGPAAALVGNFAALEQIGSLPTDVYSSVAGTVVSSDHTVTAVEEVEEGVFALTGEITMTVAYEDGVEEPRVLQDIVLVDEGDGLAVFDYRRDDDNLRLSEVTAPTANLEATVEGVTVILGPAVGNPGTGLNFADIPVALNNQGSRTVSLYLIQDASLDNPATIVTVDDLFYARDSYGEPAGPGETTIGLISFNNNPQELTEPGALEVRLVDTQTGEEFEVVFDFPGFGFGT